MSKIKASIVILSLLASLLSSCNRSKKVQLACPTIETDLSGLKSEGSLFLEGDGTHLMDMDSLGMKKINNPDEVLYYFAFSPERNWIAYNTTKSNGLVVADAENNVIKSLPLEDDWAYVDWLNEDQLIIPLIPKDQMSDVSSFLVLNPFTNERHILNADYPEMLYDEPWRIIEYSPKIDRVVYLQGYYVSGPFYYTLWDIQSKTAIAQLATAGDMHAFPRWSSDGSQFAMGLNLSSKISEFPSYEIFRVLRDGQITQLTHLSEYYPWVYVADLSWSPDSRYIAFWYSHWNEDPHYYAAVEDRNLGVLDVKTGMTTNYCIRGELDSEIGIRKYSPPLWSPDSRQIVVRSQIGDDYVLDSQTILLDVLENRAYLIGNALEPVGWLNSP